MLNEQDEQNDEVNDGEEGDGDSGSDGEQSQWGPAEFDPDSLPFDVDIEGEGPEWGPATSVSFGLDLDHSSVQAPDFEFGDEIPVGGPSRKQRALKKGLTILGIVFLAALGVGLGWYSFTDIERMRQLERTPQVPNASVITGEVNVSGRVMERDELLSAPDTGAPSVYYHYRVEERQTDDHGNEWWETVSTSSDSVDFFLVDSTGPVMVAASEPGINFEGQRKSRRESGARRYTEERIDPGDEVFVFGYAEEVPAGYRIGFQKPGNYYPVVSAGTELGQRQHRAVASGGFIVLGIAAWLFAVLLLLRMVGVHHSAFYLSTATMVLVAALTAQGMLMMMADVRAADDTAAHTLEEGQRVIGELLAEHDIDWDGDPATLGTVDEERYGALSKRDRERVSGIRMMMARSVQRTNDNLSRFPEMFIGPMIGIEPLEPVELPPEEQARVQAMEAGHRPVRLGFFYGLGAIFIGVLGTLFGTRWAIGAIGVKRTIENVPTSPTGGAVYGLTELKGEVDVEQGDDALVAPLSKRPCAYFRYTVERRTKHKNETSWDMLCLHQDRDSLYCRDHEGRMFIDVDGAELHTARQLQRWDGDRRFTEWSILVGDPLYALGSAKINPDTHDELILGEAEDDDDDSPFIVSTLSEREVMQKKAGKGFAILNIGLVATVMAGLGLAGMVVSFGPLLYVTIAAISCGYLFVILAFLYYNDLVFLRDRVDRGWSNIDVALKKRVDLIENLAEVVQEYLGHEQQLQREVARARQAHEAADHESPDEEELAAEAEARDHLTAIVESNPELKSQELVEQLMQALEEVENDIALMRQGYNDSVERYNTRIDHFPELFVARIAGFEKASLLEDGRSVG